MKIAHIITGLEPDGAETMLYKLLATMDRRRFTPLVICLTSGGPLAARIEDLGVPVFCCDMRPGRLDVSAAFRMVARLRDFEPDLLQGWMYHGNLAAQFAAALLPRRTPVIWNVRGSHCALREEKPLTAAAIWLSARLSALPAAIVNNSKASAAMHEQLLGYRRDASVVIPNGFDVERFQPSESARVELRARLRLPEDALLIGMIGRYHPVKDHSNFLRAAAIFHKEAPHAHFVLAGAGIDPANRVLREELRSLGLLDCVHLLGARTDVHRVTAALDVATSASTSEGFPNVIGEAMSCAVPCVVTDVGDSSWLAGETGLTVPPRDAEALARGWSAMVARGSSGRRALGAAARERIVRHFSIASITRQYEELYERTLGPAKGKPAVVQVFTRLGAGGPPIQGVLLTREMPKLGYPSKLVAGSCDKQDGDMAYLLSEKDAVHYIPEMSRAVSPWRDLQALFAMYRYFRREKPSIVHTHTAKAGVIGRIAARLAGVPVVIHTFHGNVLNHYFSKPANWAIRMIERALACFTDGICVLAPQQAEEIAGTHRIAPQSKVHLVPLGLDLTPLLLMPEPALAGGKITAGWMGRFVPVKNIPLLLAAVRETLRRTDRVRFVVAGDGPDAPLVKALAEELGPDRFEWLGWRQDVQPVLAQCDVMIQTSRNEGTPVALIEGMAAGRPFISTPAGGVVNMVTGAMRREQNGCRWFDNGVLAAHDPNAFASALCELAENPAAIQRMGSSATEFACATHSLPVMLESLNSLYTTLLQDAGPVSAALAPQRI